jgi:RNA polymerase sigma factor (sigma-70 family)
MATTTMATVLHKLRRCLRRQDHAGLSDGQLLESYIARRDEFAFEELVRRHGPMVLGLCRRLLHHEADAEDAIQATFLVLVKKASSVQPPDRVGNWLYGVAHSTALKARAQRSRRSALERKAAARPSPEAAEAVEWLQTLLARELRLLPEKYRAVIVLCDLEGKSIKDAARQLAAPIGTVGTRLARGRALLARRLANHGLTLSGGLIAALLAQQAAASVPSRLLGSTVTAASLFAAGQAASVISPRVAALAEGVLNMRFARRLKAALLATLACTLLVTVAAGLSARSRATGVVITGRSVASAGPAAPGRAPANPPQEGTVIAVPTDDIQAAAFTPDSQLLAAGGMDGKVRFWDTRNNKLTRTLSGPKGPVRRVEFSHDGKMLAAGADDGGIYLWNVMTGKLAKVLRTELPRKVNSPTFVNGLVFLPGDKLAAAYNYQPIGGGEQDAQIKLWDIRAGKETTLLEQHGSSYSLARSPDGTLLAATLQGDFNGFKVWALDRRAVVWDSEAGPDFMTTAVFSPDGKKLALGGGHAIQVGQGWRTEARLWLFDVPAKKQLWHVQEPANGCYSNVAFTADGKGVLTGSSGAIRDMRINGAQGKKVISELRRWDAATGKVVWRSEGELGWFYCLTAAADGKTLAGSDSAQFMLFDPDSGLLREVLMKSR